VQATLRWKHHYAGRLPNGHDADLGTYLSLISKRPTFLAVHPPLLCNEQHLFSNALELLCSRNSIHIFCEAHVAY